MASITIDTSGIAEVVADWTQAPALLARHVRPAVSKGALAIKNQLVADMRASAHFKGVARAISYDLLDDGYTAEIGPSAEAKSPGNLANVAYFGVPGWTGRRNPGRGWQQGPGGGGSVAPPTVALEAEAPAFQQAVADALAQVLQ